MEECPQYILNLNLLNLTITSSKHVAIKIELHIFKGDKPATQSEAGQQKGDSFFCFSCSV